MDESGEGGLNPNSGGIPGVEHSIDGVGTTLSRVAYGHIGHELRNLVVINRGIMKFVHVPFKELRARDLDIKFLAHAAGVGGSVGACSKPSG